MRPGNVIDGASGLVLATRPTLRPPTSKILYGAARLLPVRLADRFSRFDET
jgi:hypothetical protein